MGEELNNSETPAFEPFDFECRDGRVVTLRPVILEDAQSFLAYLELVGGETDFLTFGAGEVGLTVESERKMIHLFTKRGLMFVAEFNGEIVAGASLRVHGPRPRVKHFSELGISVLRSFWGQGLGTVMMEHTLGWAEDHGVTKLNLGVMRSNERALSMYQRLGFKEEGIITKKFNIRGRYEDEIVMGLDLASS
jgi:RimJ/RimL family protein N-acetyltransferase